MRPVSMIWFERLYGAAVLVAVAGWIVSFGGVQIMLAVMGAPVWMAYLSLISGIAIPVLLWWLIARRGSDVARWVLVVFTALAVAGLLFAIAQGHFVANLADLLNLVRILLQIAALATTFRPDARAFLVRPRAEETHS